MSIFSVKIADYANLAVPFNLLIVFRFYYFMSKRILFQRFEGST